MRTLLFVFATLLLPVAGCWQGEDLGDAPFTCTKNEPQCPDGYYCGQISTPPKAGPLPECTKGPPNKCVCTYIQ